MGAPTVPPGRPRGAFPATDPPGPVGRGAADGDAVIRGNDIADLNGRRRRPRPPPVSHSAAATVRIESDIVPPGDAGRGEADLKATAVLSGNRAGGGASGAAE